MTADHNPPGAAETGGAVELLACPFCGADVRLSSEGEFYQVVCQDCGSKAAEYPNDMLAALAWNTRAPVVSSQAGERETIIKQCAQIALDDAAIRTGSYQADAGNRIAEAILALLEKR